MTDVSDAPAPGRDSRRRSLRPAAVAAAGASALLLLFSPIADDLVTSPPLSSAARSVRDLNYDTTPARLHDSNALRDSLRRMPRSHRGLVVMASSEVTSDVEQNPTRFLPRTVRDFDLFLSGRSFQQSYAHAIELAAVADDLSTRRVALILSPQWFAPGGETAGGFKEVFSGSLMQDALANPRLSDATRDALVARARALQVDPIWLPTPDDPVARVSAFLSSTADALTRRLTILKERFEAARDTAAYTAPYANAQGAVDVSRIDWAAERRKAEAQGRAATAGNAYGIDAKIYAKQDPARLAQLKGSWATMDFAADSPEWSDLDLFLDVARDNGIQVLLVSQPVNGRWYDFLGYDASRRARYYERVRQVARTHGVQLADFSGHEYESYFDNDSMHLGWKGWLDVTQACVQFATT